MVRGQGTSADPLRGDQRRGRDERGDLEVEEVGFVVAAATPFGRARLIVVIVAVAVSASRMVIILVREALEQPAQAARRATRPGAGLPVAIEEVQKVVHEWDPFPTMARVHKNPGRIQ